MDSPFAEKRKTIQQLLGMLKSHASNEVDSGLQKPNASPDMHGIQAEKVEVVGDHKMDEPMPRHDVITHDMADGGLVRGVDGLRDVSAGSFSRGGLVDALKDVSPGTFAKGGVVVDVNADTYAKKPAGDIPTESDDGEPDKKGAAHAVAVESKEEQEENGNMDSPFQSFFRKGKKR